MIDAENDNQYYARFDRLISSHKDFIKGLCMLRSNGYQPLCSELLQECYITLWRYLPGKRAADGSLQEKAWVHWLCRSAFSHYGKRRSTLETVQLDEQMAESIADSDDRQLREYVESFAEVLNEHEREAYSLMLDGYSPKEMAALLNIKRRSAITLRYRIVDKIRQHYAPQGQPAKRNVTHGDPL